MPENEGMNTSRGYVREHIRQAVEDMNATVRDVRQAGCLHQWNAWGSRVTAGRLEWHRECQCGAVEVRAEDPLA